MCEYGGYIEFEYYHGKEYHENAISLNSGRHCVEYILCAKHIKKLYIPYFICNSIPNLCKKLGVTVSHYHIGTDFLPIFEGNLADGESLYIVNYYNQISDSILTLLKKKYNSLILDNAHAFFRKTLEGIDTCYTCRKFFGVTDGGYLYTDTLLEQKLPLDYSHDRMTFLFGRMEKGANAFYEQYAANNRRFAKEPLKQMSLTTKNLMRSLDYELIRQKRTDNFAYLHSKLSELNQLTLEVPDGAFMYPLYITNGDKIRRALQKKKIYIPTLWPDVFELCHETELEYDMANNILPLPVDQRYGIHAMDIIIDNILKIRDTLE